MGPVFELCDESATGPEEDLLGLWTPVPSVPTEGIVFRAATEAEETGLVWRANYPADLEQAERSVSEARAALAAAEAALAEAPLRLNAFVVQERSGLSFGLGAPGAQPARAEDDLSLLLGEMWGTTPMVEFSAGKELFGRWDEAYQAFQSFADRLQRMVAQYAWVETQVDGRLLGQTAVSWTGDVDTVLLDRLDREQMQLHQQTLGLALASRRAMVQTFTLVVTNATKISVLLATPGGIALALPAVLRFINQIRKELSAKKET
jgi:hypothetical protein